MNYPTKTKLPLLICLIICFIGYAVTRIDAETPIADYVSKCL